MKSIWRLLNVLRARFAGKRPANAETDPGFSRAAGRVWLAQKQNVPVPIGPVRKFAQLTDKNLDHYHSVPDDQGIMLDGDPFWLFWQDEDGRTGERMLTTADRELELLGRKLTLHWHEAVADTGLLLIIHGDLNVGGDSDYLVNRNPRSGLRESYAYCLGWNNMGGGRGPLTFYRTLLQFGLATEDRPEVETSGTDGSPAV